MFLEFDFIVDRTLKKENWMKWDFCQKIFQDIFFLQGIFFFFFFKVLAISGKNDWNEPIKKKKKNGPPPATPWENNIFNKINQINFISL